MEPVKGHEPDRSSVTRRSVPSEKDPQFFMCGAPPPSAGYCLRLRVGFERWEPPSWDPDPRTAVGRMSAARRCGRPRHRERSSLPRNQNAGIPARPRPPEPGASEMATSKRTAG